MSEELATGNPETFLGELENMNLDELRDKTFVVAISTGSRDKCNFICNTMRGPFDFYEMVENMGRIYQEQQLHGKAAILSDDFDTGFKFLDECTSDYIEAKYEQIVMEGLLGGDFDTDYTYKAGIIEETEESDSET
jgi:hypothetical protein